MANVSDRQVSFQNSILPYHTTTVLRHRHVRCEDINILVSALQHATATATSSCPLRLPTLDSQPRLDSPLTPPYPQCPFDNLIYHASSRNIPKQVFLLITYHYSLRKSYIGSRCFDMQLDCHLPRVSPEAFSFPQLPIFLSAQLTVIVKLRRV